MKGEKSSSEKARVLFLGRNNPFNLGVIDWLNENFELVGAFFVEPGRFGLKGRLKRIRRRARKYGILSVIDELAFQVHFSLLDKRRNLDLLKRDLPPQFIRHRECPFPHWNVANPHDSQWLAKLDELRPDLLFVVCCNVILRKELYSRPRFGAFVLHEGLVPEYKGLHTPLWALLNRDYRGVGYSLIQVDDSLDGGPVLAQDTVIFDNPQPQDWSYIGHRALVLGLPDIAEKLKKLTREGGFVPVNVEGRIGHYYTWIRLSEYIRLQVRLRRLDSRHSVLSIGRGSAELSAGAVSSDQN